ncbi:hypothetical protein E2C01_001265 [Portunus trituberculatus]|uniref:Uncharacterized protein n=1 Tax=Portunus trituberculatus TaxID=210409 RepID=A0A5B7CGA0_PORTR|nr:hypothetical protein [Portunus trituberculatus]
MLLKLAGGYKRNTATRQVISTPDTAEETPTHQLLRKGQEIRNPDLADMATYGEAITPLEKNYACALLCSVVVLAGGVEGDWMERCRETGNSLGRPSLPPNLTNPDTTMLARLLVPEEFIDDPVLDTVDIIHSRFEVLSRQEKEKKEHRLQKALVCLQCFYREGFCYVAPECPYLLPDTPHSLLWVMHSLCRRLSVIRIEAELKVTRRTIYKLKTVAENFRLGAVLVRKSGSGALRKMSLLTGKVLARKVKEDRSITALSLKEKHLNLLQNVSKDLELPARHASKKLLLTEAMYFFWKYMEWTLADWQKVMFSDESTFRLVRGDSKVMRRPSNVSCYDPRYTVKMVGASSEESLVFGVAPCWVRGTLDDRAMLDDAATCWGPRCTSGRPPTVGMRYNATNIPPLSSSMLHFCTAPGLH